MKKLILFAAAMLMLAAGICQTEAKYKSEIKYLNNRETAIKERKKYIREELRKLEGTMISTKTQQQFTSDFGNVLGSGWAHGTYYDEATFLKDGQTQTAFYDYDSKLVGTVTNKKFADLPANAQEYVNTKYGDYTKLTVIYYDDNEANENNIVMFNETADRDSYFIQLQKDNRSIVLKVTTTGDVSFFSQLF